MEPQTTKSTPQPNEPTQSQPSSSSPNPNPNLSQNPNPNLSQSPNPNPNSINATRPPLTSQQPYQQQHSQVSQATRPPFNRPWQPPPQQQSAASASALPFSQHFGSSAASASVSVSGPGSSVPTPVQRGGVAIGVLAAQSAPFSTLNSVSYGQQYGALGRNVVNVPDSATSSSSTQVRQPIQGYQGTGMIGSLGTVALVRPGGVSTPHQSRPIPPSLRPQPTPNNQPSATQNFQGHSLLRTSSVGSPASPSPNTSQSTPSNNQPWLSPVPGSQGKPPLPSPSFRPQINQLSQGSHNPQNHLHSLPTASQQQQKISSSQQLQQPLPSHQNEVPGKQFVAPFRAPQILPIQQHITRLQGAGNQKPSTLATIHPTTAQTVSQDRTANVELGESCNRILSKRSIHELVNQIDPSENLDPEVEDILVDIADEFVESITTFGCSLAKHRKSSTLEAKDILLHLERNWNMTLPGFSGDEIKTYKKPISNDIHKERLAAIKKSLIGNETTNTKSAVGQGAQKGHMVKAPNAMES